jgi:hypothetical protein
MHKAWMKTGLLRRSYQKLLANHLFFQRSNRWHKKGKAMTNS